MIDDGSPYQPQDRDISVNHNLENFVFGEKGTIFRFPDRLGRSATLNYPGWFRSFTFSVVIAKRFDFQRILHIESDADILSRRALDFINGRTTGWTVFWCPRYQFPETSLQLICDDSFSALEQIRATPYETHYVNKRIEEHLPYTHIETSIYGDQFGEYLGEVPRYADFAVQINEHTRFNSRL